MVNLKIETVPVESIRPTKWNPNSLQLKKYNHLKREIVRVGIVRPIITNLAGDIINGEHRWRAAREMGFPEVPIIRLDVDETTAKTLSVNLNAIHGEMDHDKLAMLVAGLDIVFPKDDLMEILNYTEKDMAALMEGTERDKGSLAPLPSGPKPVPPIDEDMGEGACQCPKCGYKFDEEDE